MQTTHSTRPKKFFQLSINSFTVQKTAKSGPFIPVDIVQDPAPPKIAKRGRPKKNALPPAQP